ncbi:MAG: homocysteine S-methyltransferase family protein [Clostridia bacterium]|nr:homocysteine S-methyltransferase family protein [Clostridia bacterium]
MSLKTLIQKGFVFFDGAMGTQLHECGLKTGSAPEEWNILYPEIVTKIHKDYFIAGANIATANTFGANPLKTAKYEQYIKSAIDNAKSAVYKENQYVALDIGPTGKLLKPLGELDFEEAYQSFSKVIIAGNRAGADLILIETMSDPYELKAAILAAKEHSKLPVCATFVLDANGKTITGADIPTMVALLEGLGVDALGVNCSLGAKQLKQYINQIIACSSIPVIVNPNAGMPYVLDGKTYYDSSVESFTIEMEEIASMGARILGGCCGTTPSYIQAIVSSISKKNPKPIEKKNITVVSSGTKTCEFGDTIVLIGERINPTGKPKLKAAIRENNIDYIISEAIGQEEKCVNMLDVNVGLPEIDETIFLPDVIKEIQTVTSLPLQIDTSNKEALEKAMRVYNGKPLVNSVNGEQESMDSVFPLVKKYGGAVIALTLDKNGIPSTAYERFQIAKKIVEEAAKYGIDKKDIIVDTLCLTVSSDKEAPMVTLQAMKMIKEKLGVKVSLGISNVSFGLPKRDVVNSTFFALALANGLDAVIMNPYSEDMMKVYYAHNALMGKDVACEKYIAFASSVSQAEIVVQEQSVTLEKAIIKGLKKEAREITNLLLQTNAPLEIVDKYIIPALNIVGESYEKGITFLPQLLLSAETATVAFDVIKENVKADETTIKGEIIIATVKGDVHDIGKNIVKVILQNYGYKVFDLGKDVSPQSILEKVIEIDCKLVGLSALMTTTVPAMEQTISLIKEKHPQTKIMVGGAVLNLEYSKIIGADKYAKDAMEAVRFAQEIFN